jgi:hypothetical protein
MDLCRFCVILHRSTRKTRGSVKTSNQLTKTFQNDSILMKNDSETIILVVFWVCKLLYCRCAKTGSKTGQELQFCHRPSEHN